MSDHKLYWGDAHTNLHTCDLDCLPRLEQAARERLDFWPLAYYPHGHAERNGYIYEDWKPREQLDREWRAICDFAAESNEAGEFVVFPGYEWQGNGRFGDHNVFHFDDHQPLLHVDTLPELYEGIRRKGIKAIAIPHHTAYAPGVRSKNWEVHDEELSPFAEIFSAHGCSESDEEWLGLRHNWGMAPGVSGGTIEDGLNHGHRFGIMCSGDNHHGFAGVYGRGLMACYATALTREALWDAFAARRVYGVSADRIALDFRVEGAMMGAVIQNRGPVCCQVKVGGADALDRIELLRNNRVIACHCHNGTWDLPADDAMARCKLRIEAGWGGEHEWAGSIRVPNGVIRSVERCWKDFGQSVGKPGGHRCDFTFQTKPKIQAVHLPIEKYTEATVFEIEARSGDSVLLELDGKKLAMTLAEAMGRSQIIYFPEEVEARIQARHGIDPSTLLRPDPFYYSSRKAKVHRAIPEAGFTAAWDYTDSEPPTGRNHYRVRVHQRNGSVAWSSPVWVEAS